MVKNTSEQDIKTHNETDNVLTVKLETFPN